MQKFIHEFTVTTAYLPQSYRPDFNTLIQDIDPIVHGSVKCTLQPLHQNVSLHQVKDWTNLNNTVLPLSSILGACNAALHSDLRSLYVFLYPDFTSEGLTIHQPTENIHK